MSGSKKVKVLDDVNSLDIFIVDLAYRGEIKGHKTRPVLIVAVGSNVIFAYKITSQYEQKSDRVKQKYYPIKYWQEAHLKKPSYVDIITAAELDFEDLKGKKRIGMLSDEDARGLFDMIGGLD